MFSTEKMGKVDAFEEKNLFISGLLWYTIRWICLLIRKLDNPGKAVNNFDSI